MKPQHLVVVREDPIDHERVDVHVQVQRAAEPLDDDHRPAAAIRDAVPPRALAQKPKHGTHVHGHHRPTEIVIPGEQVPQAVRDAQDPLPHRHVGKHVIDEMSRTLRHPSAAAAGTESPSLTREGHEPIVPAPVAVKAGESGRQAPAGQEVAELLLDKSGEPFPVAQRRRLGAERLEVFEHDLMEQALSGIARLVACGRLDHTPHVGGRDANRRREHSGPKRVARPSPLHFLRLLPRMGIADFAGHQP
jgi:hypothetical protein